VATFRRRQFVTGYTEVEVEAGSIEEAVELFETSKDIGVVTIQGVADTFYCRDDRDITEEFVEVRSSYSHRKKS
jgi:hypothetical protein